MQLFFFGNDEEFKLLRLRRKNDFFIISFNLPDQKTVKCFINQTDMLSVIHKNQSKRRKKCHRLSSMEFMTFFSAFCVTFYLKNINLMLTAFPTLKSFSVSSFMCHIVHGKFEWPLSFPVVQVCLEDK
jgi:hypothetical protein